MTFYKERRAVLQAPKSTDVNFVLSYNLPVHLCADGVDHIRCRRQSAGNMRREVGGIIRLTIDDENAPIDEEENDMGTIRTYMETM